MSNDSATSGTEGQVPHLAIERYPENDSELWEFVANVWGIEIPWQRKCPHHCAPFDAFADGFFARSSVAVWKASRAFGGKSTLLALLGQTEAAILGASVTILGGSGAQSRRVLEAMDEAWRHKYAPRGMLATEPGNYIIRLTNEAKIQALRASATSVRGPHPHRLRLDEIDEMKLAIMDAAMGQPMTKGGIQAQTVLSSTHHNPNGTMEEALNRAGKKGWSVFEWCYRECLEPDGWLLQSEVDRKRNDVTSTMWDVEFELQEPSAEGRAFLPEKVEQAFSTELGEFEGEEGRYLEFEPPIAHATYVHGADWGHLRDYSVIMTFRVEEGLWQLVAFDRVQRRPWPDMVERLNQRMTRYPGTAAHDRTGVGDVVKSYFKFPVEDVVFAGNVAKRQIYSSYVAALEKGVFLYPMVRVVYNSHKYCGTRELYYDGHTPDEIVAAAVAYTLYKKAGPRIHTPDALGQRVTATRQRI